MAFEEKYDKVNKKYVSTRPLLHKFNILNFDNHCKLTIGKFMWEISQNLHPAFIQCLFTKVSEKHQIMTRSSSLTNTHCHMVERISESTLSISQV